MAAKKKTTPDFFAESPLDPVESATGYPNHQGRGSGLDFSAKADKDHPINTASKKKAGFYLSVDILNRFTLKFHELKLAGVAVDNKSTLLELALCYALDDLDKGKQSRVLKKLLD